jgi:hypothetical protein
MTKKQRRKKKGEDKELTLKEEEMQEYKDIKLKGEE